jgi:hypothetical protein
MDNVSLPVPEPHQGNPAPQHRYKVIMLIVWLLAGLENYFKVKPWRKYSPTATNIPQVLKGQTHKEDYKIRPYSRTAESYVLIGSLIVLHAGS